MPPQNWNGKVIPAGTKGCLVSCVSGKEVQASKEAQDLMTQVPPQSTRMHACAGNDRHAETVAHGCRCAQHLALMTAKVRHEGSGAVPVRDMTAALVNGLQYVEGLAPPKEAAAAPAGADIASLIADEVSARCARCTGLVRS